MRLHVLFELIIESSSGIAIVCLFHGDRYGIC